MSLYRTLFLVCFLHIFRQLTAQSRRSQKGWCVSVQHPTLLVLILAP